MKKLLIIMVSLGLVIGASAQRFGGHGGGGYYGGGPRVVVGVGVGAYAPFYSPFYNPYYPWGIYGGYGYRSSQLDMQIRDIKNEYNDRIWSVKNDKSLTRKEKRHQVHLLKQERDRDIENAKLNYFKRN